MGLTLEEKYLKVCRDAVTDEEVFRTFKQHKDYTLYLEHCSYDQGKAYIEVIKRDNPDLFFYMPLFCKNDILGSPHKYFYEEVGQEISPTTLRYVKTLSDLIKLYGSLDGMDIVEVGVGYGGQCKIIADYFQFKSYTLIDLDDVLNLSAKYLSGFLIDDLSFIAPYELRNTFCDLFISNYAFTEIDRRYQELYRDYVIAYSDKGYITCNVFGSGRDDDKLSKDGILGLKDNYKILPEEPLTHDINFIYTWG